uniref:Putative secreted protein n=1 Tax=Anopheles darlingi TaxID=43151 RepID=A0A2M4DHS2_ANODA
MIQRIGCRVQLVHLVCVVWVEVDGKVIRKKKQNKTKQETELNVMPVGRHRGLSAITSNSSIQYGEQEMQCRAH